MNHCGHSRRQGVRVPRRGNNEDSNINGRWAVSGSLQLFARIENKLDEDYQQILGYGTPGRSAYVDARLRY